MGLLDNLQLGHGANFGGGLLDFLRTTQMQQDQYQPSAGFGQNPMDANAQMQAAPMSIGGYQMPRIGDQAQFTPPPVATDFSAQSRQPQPQQAPQMAQESPGGFGAGMQGFLRNLHTGPIGALVGGIGSAAGMQDPGRQSARLQANQTAAYLRNVGVPEAAIAAAVGDGRVPGNTEVLKTLLAKYGNQEKVRPATPEERQQYGAPPNLPMSIDTTTGKPSYGPANTSISNVINGEKEQDKTLGKGYGDRQLEIQKAGFNAPAALGTLNLMEKIISDPNFYSGTGGESATRLKTLAVSLGIAGAETAQPNELFQKLSQKSVLDAAGGSLGAGFSNTDREYINGTVANINNTPEGNKQIIALGRQVQQRSIEVAKQAREYAKRNGGRLDAGFDEQIAEYAEKNPMFGGMGGQKDGGAPDMSKARKAPDGNTYVPDPARPGKFLKVTQ